MQTNGQWAKESEYGVEEDGEETDEEEVGPAHRCYLLWLLGGGVTDPAALTFNPRSAFLSWERASVVPPSPAAATVRSYEKEVVAMMERGFACHFFHLSLTLVFKSGLVANLATR